MDIFLQKYKAMCNAEFKKYGFKNYRNNYYRVINDMFQSFSLHRSVSGDICTVEFLIAPLCRTNLNKTSCGVSHLKNFEGLYSWFDYDKNSEESINDCLSSMLSYMHNYLMPFFEKSSRCKNAYYAICEFEKISGCISSDIPGYSLYSGTKALIALKNSDYDTSVKHFKEIEAQHLYAYKKNQEMLGNNLTTEYTEKFNHKMKLLQEKIEHISKHDTNYINNLISVNEEENLSNLK